jgi:hypothetical protein|nr:MAG TPA: hypothetical protein [Caudoviricetes sp.]
MGTISDKLMRIINTKEDIRQALISKGYDVPTSIPFKEYAKMISDLPCRVDSFPDIEGIVARYSALGLTNEQMAANPVWVDKTGNGHDLQMKNFLWAGMSGVGGYVYKWNILSEWILYSENATAELTSSTIHVTEAKTANPFLERKSKTGGYSKMEIKVTGIKDGEILKFMSDLGISNRIEIKKDGIYSLPGSSKEYYGFRLSNSTNTYPFNCDITIEQLPLYPGALVFDGVDDYGTCDNFPILTKEKGYTVVALRQWISMGEGISGLVSNVKNWFNDGAFVLEYNSNNATNKFVNRPVSFGNTNIEMDLPNNFTYQTSKSYKGVPITTGSFKGTNSLFVGKLNNIIGNCSNVAIWELVFLDHDATEEELTKIKDYFVKTYPWLFPDQAWTVVGKTNEDKDRATIANITGNGNDLILSNFGFAEGSGYGLYNIQKFTNWNHVADRGDIVKNGYSVTITNSKITGSSTNYNTDILYSYNSSSTTIIFKVTGLVDGQKIFLGRKSVTDAYVIDKDGIYRSDYNIPQEGGKVIVGIGTVGFTGECNITIEQIPEYEGYLITDGVDDKVVSAESIAFTDTWTIITDTVFLGKVSVASGILASNIFTVYNYQGSGTIAVTMGEGGSSLRVITSSIKAFSSDGTIYDAEWNEYHVEIGTIRALERLLKIGTSSNETSYFCQLAFKFLGIYNNQILSKDDCIKAYNYLQTLKAK